MKKKIFVGLLIIIGIVSFISVLIPSALPVGATVPVSSSSAASSRLLFDTKEWKKWWPGTISGDTLFTYNENHFTIQKLTLNNLEVQITNAKLDLKGALIIIPISNDSLVLDWKYIIPTGYNPIRKIRAYFEAKKLANDLSTILNKVKGLLEDNFFLYGVKIQKEKVVDTLLISSKLAYNKYPDMNDAYTLIGKLEKLLADQQIKGTNPPMLHIRKLDSAMYETQVAIPILQWPKTDANSQIKRMIMGNILTTVVNGGPSSVKKAYQNMQQYIYDHNMAQPAIPYESLITNRMQEKDTSKWVTKIYFPVY